MVSRMKRNKVLFVVISVCLFIAIGLIIDEVKASNDEPGSVGDPLVTKSYVDQKIAELAGISSNNEGQSEDIDLDELYAYIDEQSVDINELYAYIDEQLEDIEVQASTDEAPIENTSSDNGFSVIELSEGDRLICKASAEVILRAGSATAIANEYGDGISDVTEGKDLKEGETIPTNHLLIVPKNDGRGLFVHSHSYIMIKGDYRIE